MGNRAVVVTDTATIEAPAKAPRFTRKVRRGLLLARQLLLASFDDDALPSRRAVKAWTLPQEHDFNAAMAWLESVEIDTTKEA